MYIFRDFFFDILKIDTWMNSDPAQFPGRVYTSSPSPLVAQTIDAVAAFVRYIYR